MKPCVRLPEDIERDVRTVLRWLRGHGQVEVFLVQNFGHLRVRTVGRDCERIGRYVVDRSTAWEDLGEIIRQDVQLGIEQAKQIGGMR